jgi:hypothetical protein
MTPLADRKKMDATSNAQLELGERQANEVQRIQLDIEDAGPIGHVSSNGTPLEIDSEPLLPISLGSTRSIVDIICYVLSSQRPS